MKNLKDFVIGIFIAVSLFSCKQDKKSIFQKGCNPCDTVCYGVRDWSQEDRMFQFLSIRCFPVPANSNTKLLGWDPVSERITNMPYDWGQPKGAIQYYAGSTAPTGYLLCDGSAVSRTTYADLFSVIGTVYGSGNGSTTFNVPDLRQRFALTKANSGTGSTLAATGGSIDHVHSVDPPSTSSGVPSATVAATNLTGSAASTTHTHNVDISAFNSASENPPYLVVNAIIKY